MRLSDTQVSPERVEAFRRYLLGLSIGKESALQAIEGLRDPESLRRKAKILLDIGKTREAVEAIKDVVSVDNIEIFVIACLRAGEVDTLFDALSHTASQDAVVATRCVVIALGEIYKDDLNTAAIRRLSDVERDVCVRLNAYARPPTLIERNGSDLDRLFEVVWFGILKMRLDLGIGDIDEAVSRLESAVPIPLHLVDYALNGLISAKKAWISRLKSEHAVKRAVLAAAALQGLAFDDRESAFNEIQGIAKSEMLSDTDRFMAFTALHEIAGALGATYKSRLISLAPGLLSAHPKSKGLFDAEVALETGNLATAEILLERWQDRDDPVWLQLYAQALKSKGEIASAVELARGYAERSGWPPNVASLVAHLATEAGNSALAIEALGRVVEARPKDAGSRRALAIMQCRIGERVSALPHLERLHRDGNVDEVVTVLLAQCMAAGGNRGQAIKILRDGVLKWNESLRLQLALSSMLTADAQVEEAFAALRDSAEKFRENHQFLLAYMSAAHRAGRDDVGSAVLKDLISLRDRGLLPDEVLRPATLDDVLQVGRQHQEKVKKTNEQLLIGKIPWLTLPLIDQVPIVCEWAVRTQPMRWVGEAPWNVSAYSLYSTNGFTVVDGDGGAKLEEIEVPESGASVTLDFSAVTTFMELGILKAASKYFQRIFVPSSYFEHSERERVLLLPHQLSQKRTLEDIEDLLSRGVLVVTNGEGELLLSEYEDGDGFVRINDVLKVLAEVGGLTDDEQQRLNQVAHSQSARGTSLHRRMRIELTTLKTLVGVGVIDILSRYWKLAISSADRDEMAATLRAYRNQDALRKKHESFWAELRSAPFVAQILSATKSADPEESSTRLLVDGVAVATATNSALLADDRYTQQVYLSSRDSRSRCFGTDKVLCALVDKFPEMGSELAKKYLMLLEMRYKFLIPSVRMIGEIINLHRGTFPNRGLLQVARYIHGSFRDPGLYAGLEATKPPTSIAVRLYLTWVSRLAHLVANLWSSPGVDEAEAEALSTWILRNCLPSFPFSVGSAGAAIVASRMSDYFVGQYASAVVAADPQFGARVSKGFAVIRHELGLSPERFLDGIHDLVSGIIANEE